MKYSYLPSTQIKVSKICLGTMTFGNQNSEHEAFEQMDYALDKGVNFFDTAELYPVPATPQLYADTEKIIGKWMKERKNRDQIVLATKIAGPGDYTCLMHSPFVQKPHVQSFDFQMSLFQDKSYLL